MKNVKAICIGDLHITESTPLCRTDDWLKTVQSKLGFIADVCEQHLSAHIYIAGDIFDRAKPPLSTVRLALEWLNKIQDIDLCRVYAVAGNHDMPTHNPGLLNKSGVGLLNEASGLTLTDGDGVVCGYPWGTKLEEDYQCIRQVALVHAMIYKDKPPFPGAEGYEAKEVCKTMSQFKLIVSGHNHQTFTARVGKTTLVNPGSVFRTTADQMEHRPSIFLWDGEELEQVFLPINRRAMSREHIDAVHQRDERIEAFVTRLDADYEVGLSYTRNMQKFLSKNKELREGSRRLLEEAIAPK